MRSCSLNCVHTPSPGKTLRVSVLSTLAGHSWTSVVFIVVSYYGSLDLRRNHSLAVKHLSPAYIVYTTRRIHRSLLATRIHTPLTHRALQSSAARAQVVPLRVRPVRRHNVVMEDWDHTGWQSLTLVLIGYCSSFVTQCVCARACSFRSNLRGAADV